MKGGTSTMLKYRVHIRYSGEDECFVAEAPELPGCKADGATWEAAAAALGEVAALWLDVAREEGRPTPEPDVAAKAYNGKILLRVPQWLHRALDEGAAEQGVSLNQHILALLAAAGGKAADRRPDRARSGWQQAVRETPTKRYIRIAKTGGHESAKIGTKVGKKGPVQKRRR